MKQLTILERLMLGLILNSEPVRSDIVGLKQKQKLVQDLGFVQEEIDKYQLKTGANGNTTWSAQYSGETKDIEIPEYLENLLKERLQKLNSEKQLTEDFITLYDKFIETN